MFSSPTQQPPDPPDLRHTPPLNKPTNDQKTTPGIRPHSFSLSNENSDQRPPKNRHKRAQNYRKTTTQKPLPSPHPFHDFYFRFAGTSVSDELLSGELVSNKKQPDLKLRRDSKTKQPAPTMAEIVPDPFHHSCFIVDRPTTQTNNTGVAPSPTNGISSSFPTLLQLADPKPHHW
ncbi:hypothetical protein R3W88_017161 [Solanum pinnatisectum]|uniref:Uncharacterized protein n=1 Tax=Solanum pinnatisectum TaxID=50273 RepID=A0AAV9KZG3_9SOLN|nr:hypothetical protein R3W88_017161 [Solanum pinnatisectum]